MVAQMDDPRRTLLSRLVLLGALAATFYAATACTVIRYVDDDDGTTTGPPPRVVDVLVMVDLDRGAANLTPDYGKVLGTVWFALAEQNIQVRQSAMAPLYARAQGAVPLLHGEPDEDGEFANFADAIAFYTYDAGAEYLQDPVASDSANLATLGRELDTRAIYHPTIADTSGAAYFAEPADGLVVLYLSASPRRCSVGDAACAVDGEAASEYFTAADGAGLEWLELAGGTSLPANRVFHGAIVTAEGVDYDTFYEQCAAFPNFPITKLDVMQPSEEHTYFGPFIDGVASGGGHGALVDLCEAMSSRGEPALITMAVKIRSMF